MQTKALRRDTAVRVGDDSYLLNSAIKKYCYKLIETFCLRKRQI